MGDFVEGAYVNDQGAVCNQDGSPDVLGRWVDNHGYIRVGVDGYDDDWKVTPAGQVMDASDQATAFTLTLPAGFEIVTNAALDDAATPWLAGQADLRSQGLSDTDGHAPSAQALADFQTGITRTSATDARGGDLTWAGGDAPEQATDLHGRAINPEFVGEDTHTASFAPTTMRGKQAADNTQWTTNYDRDDTDTVRAANVNDTGLLVDGSGTPLNGQFGYVVDPATGQFYTFDTSEGYVSQKGAWISTSGLSQPQLIGTVQAALNAGEQVSFVHHSTALAGSPVAGAGHLTVTQGKITEITDESGHYKPEGEYLWQTVSWLSEQGMPTDAIKVTMIAKGTEAQTILRGWQMEQTGGNQAQANLKAGVNQEVLAAETARQKAARVAALQPGSVAHQHYQATGCDNLVVGQAGSSRYCESCDTDL